MGQLMRTLKHLHPWLLPVTRPLAIVEQKGGNLAANDRYSDNRPPRHGKTTLAQYLAGELGWPLLGKDLIKETLLATLGWSTDAWSRRLSAATWAILYQQVEGLLAAGVDHIVEANFDPAFANGQWQELAVRYELQVVQIRCVTEPETLIERYRQRIVSGERHPGHVDQSDDPQFHALLRQGPLDWVDIISRRISIDTTIPGDGSYAELPAFLRESDRSRDSLEGC